MENFQNENGPRLEKGCFKITRIRLEKCSKISKLPEYSNFN